MPNSIINKHAFPLKDAPMSALELSTKPTPFHRMKKIGIKAIPVVTNAMSMIMNSVFFI